MVDQRQGVSSSFFAKGGQNSKYGVAFGRMWRVGGGIKLILVSPVVVHLQGAKCCMLNQIGLLERIEGKRLAFFLLLHSWDIQEEQMRKAVRVYEKTLAQKKRP